MKITTIFAYSLFVLAITGCKGNNSKSSSDDIKSEKVPPKVDIVKDGPGRPVSVFVPIDPSKNIGQEQAAGSISNNNGVAEIKALGPELKALTPSDENGSLVGYSRDPIGLHYLIYKDGTLCNFYKLKDGDLLVSKMGGTVDCSGVNPTQFQSKSKNGKHFFFFRDLSYNVVLYFYNEAANSLTKHRVVNNFMNFVYFAGDLPILSAYYSGVYKFENGEFTNVSGGIQSVEDLREVGSRVCYYSSFNSMRMQCINSSGEKADISLPYGRQNLSMVKGENLFFTGLLNGIYRVVKLGIDNVPTEVLSSSSWIDVRRSEDESFIVDSKRNLRVGNLNGDLVLVKDLYSDLTPEQKAVFDETQDNFKSVDVYPFGAGTKKHVVLLRLDKYISQTNTRTRLFKIFVYDETTQTITPGKGGIYQNIPNNSSVSGYVEFSVHQEYPSAGKVFFLTRTNEKSSLETINKDTATTELLAESPADFPYLERVRTFGDKTIITFVSNNWDAYLTYQRTSAGALSLLMDSSLYNYNMQAVYELGGKIVITGYSWETNLAQIFNTSNSNSIIAEFTPPSGDEEPDSRIFILSPRYSMFYANEGGQVKAKYIDNNTFVVSELEGVSPPPSSLWVKNFGTEKKYLIIEKEGRVQAVTAE